MCSYQEFQPQNTSRKRENIEWTITYHYNATDTTNPRALLIGDSISHQYHVKVRNRLANCANISNWASSKCVTDPDYFRELDFYLDTCDCQMVCFNNGAHSIASDLAEYTEAYERAVAMIRAKLPAVKLSLVLTTPQNPDDPKIQKLNAVALQVAQQYSLPVVDLYNTMLEQDVAEIFTDKYHFKSSAIDLQADFMAEHIRKTLNLTDGDLEQIGTKTGPDGAMK